MVFLNLATQQMTVKVVYYGPGLCGKTSNLQYIYQKTSPETRGEMVSLETEADRTLFFDLLPLEVGTIGGYKTKIQLYTVPGQVFYNTTRKLVLKGVDGIVFVADSQRPMEDANVESLKNLRENLKELGLVLEDIPMVLQYNKRDLPNVMTVAEMNAILNKDGRYPFVEAVATTGKGVFETLKEISKGTLKHLRKKLTEEQAPAVKRPPIPETKFTMREGGKAAAPAMTQAIPARPSPAIPAARPGPDWSDTQVSAPKGVKGAPAPSPGPAPAAPEEKIEFGQVAQPTSQTTMEVRHVRVKSSVDILGELEKLRRQVPLDAGPAKPKKKSSLPDVDMLLAGSADQRKEINKSFEVPMHKGTLQKAGEVSLSLVLRDETKKGLGEPISLTVPLKDLKSIRELLLNLKIEIREPR
jgi:hypothetical protein